VTTGVDALCGLGGSLEGASRALAAEMHPGDPMPAERRDVLAAAAA